MKQLIDILQKMNKILLLLDQTINEEHINLLDSKTNIKKLSFMIEKKHYLLNKLTYLKKQQMSLEKMYNISSPYLKFNELNYYSKKIIKKCIFLNKINLKNKKLIKHKFYLNQNFLNLYKSCKNNSIYNINGNFDN